MPDPFFHCRPYRADITRAACLTNQRQAVAQQKGELKFDWIGSRTLCLTCPERDKRVCKVPEKKLPEKPMKMPPIASPCQVSKSSEKQTNFTIPVNFKWHKDLFRKLQAAAAKNGRTISAEIVARLIGGNQ